MSRILPILITFIVLGFTTKAQEFESQIEINAEKLELSDKSIVEDLKRSLSDFMGRQWTDDEFNTEERIKANFMITIMEGTGNASKLDIKKANLQVQFSRPVYNSSYETVMFNFLDQGVSFQYQQGQPFNFNENSFMDNLSSIMGFYAFIILGMDYDSFSELGGTKYFETARNIAGAAQSSSASGWGQGEQNGRFWLEENINSQVMIPFREAMYVYHRKGLDTFYKDVEEGRKIIMEAFEEIIQVNKNKPNTLLMKNFFLAKNSELIQMFSEAPQEEKNKIVPIFKQLDPLNAEKYDRILRN
ncbi:DUF4835 family protein [Cytophagaceae bacterium ABcell3]|nr:DUF4835 family protein [Cytophagaceae bacterium ABcell3]